MNSYDSQSVKFVQTEFKKRWKLDLKITENQYSQEDLVFEWKKTNRSVEVKQRRFKKDKYPTTIIEESKYNYLLEHRGVLVVLFDDCWIIIKDLKSAYVRTSKKPARKTTDFGNQEWVIKSFVELDLKEALIYKY